MSSMQDMYFHEEVQMIRKSAEDFVDKEILPNVDKWESDRHMPTKDIFSRGINPPALSYNP